MEAPNYKLLSRAEAKNFPGIQQVSPYYRPSNNFFVVGVDGKVYSGGKDGEDAWKVFYQENPHLQQLSLF